MTNLAWVAVVVAAIFEILIARGLKEAEAFTRLFPTALVFLATAISLGLLSFAMTKLPVGTAYAVWVGLGAAGVAVFGMLAYGESTSAVRLVCIGVILTGVVGLKAYG